MKVLITGFGPFGDVVDNPSAALARAVDGFQWAEHQIIGVVLPVSYSRGPADTIRLACEQRVDLVLGFGVAMDRDGVFVERRAVHVAHGRPDVDGACVAMGVGPEERLSTVDVGRLADALGAAVSDDAGQYVCNAWLYTVTEALDVPVGFVHVPASGLSSEALLDTLRRWL